ncbi:protein of unknown function [Frankineae bacterium MT45]|nr:protein of unknown function [Frankineae bacterium MT45]
MLKLVPPSEERVFLVLGSTMLFTSIVAGFLGYATVGFLLRGAVVRDIQTVVGGLVVFAFTLTLDRLLIKPPLNPYRFPPKVLAALWNPKADASWFDIMVRDVVRPSHRERLAATFRVFRRGFVRILIAICTSYLFAQAALFYIFANEIQSVASDIRTSQQSVLTKALKTTHDSKKASLQAAIDSYDGSLDPTVGDLTTKINALKPKLAKKQADVNTMDTVVATERDGYRRCFTFVSDDAPPNGICTSGIPGTNGESYQTDVAIQNQWETAASTDSNDLTSLQSRLSSRKAALSGDKATQATIAKLQAQIKKLDDNLATDLGQLNSPLGKIKGILIRNQALGALEDDTNPDVTPIVKIAPCSHGWAGLACSAQRLVYEPTPAGPYVAAFKTLFFLIEVLPIVMKMMFSLRERRPYDELDAAIEEISRARTTEMLDGQLIHVGARLESRATWRKAQRSAVGAEFLLAAAEARASTEDEKLRAMIFGNRIGHRKRFWPFWPPRSQQIRDPYVLPDNLRSRDLDPDPIVATPEPSRAFEHD